MTLTRRSLTLGFVALALATLAACFGPGSEYVGRWENVADPTNTIEITQNGNAYQITDSDGGKWGAVLRDGYLEVSLVRGPVRLTYLGESQTLIFPGLLGQKEYKRAK